MRYCLCYSCQDLRLPFVSYSLSRRISESDDYFFENGAL